jgi:hypothetical protein
MTTEVDVLPDGWLAPDLPPGSTTATAYSSARSPAAETCDSRLDAPAATKIPRAARDRTLEEEISNLEHTTMRVFHIGR